MKSKNSTIAASAFATAAALVSAASVAKVDPPLDISKAEIHAPAYVEAGALAVFHAQGSDVNWEIFPEIPSQEFSEQNASLATSFQFPGQYLVICSYLDQNGEVQLRTHAVDVQPIGATPKPAPAPTPAPPLPPPPPENSILEPTPAPPEPVPDNYANTAFPAAADYVHAICVENEYDKAKAAKLAANFEKVANHIDDGAYKTVAAVLRETANLNRPVSEVDATTTKIQLLISRHRFDGNLREVADHADLWREISSGLARYAEEA